MIKPLTITKPVILFRKDQDMPLVLVMHSQHNTELEAITELQRIVREGDPNKYIIAILKVYWNPPEPS